MPNSGEGRSAACPSSEVACLDEIHLRCGLAVVPAVSSSFSPPSSATPEKDRRRRRRRRRLPRAGEDNLADYSSSSSEDNEGAPTVDAVRDMARVAAAAAAAEAMTPLPPRAGMLYVSDDDEDGEDGGGSGTMLFRDEDDVCVGCGDDSSVGGGAPRVRVLSTELLSSFDRECLAAAGGGGGGKGGEEDDPDFCLEEATRTETTTEEMSSLGVTTDCGGSLGGHYRLTSVDASIASAASSSMVSGTSRRAGEGAESGPSQAPIEEDDDEVAESSGAGEGAAEVVVRSVTEDVAAETSCDKADDGVKGAPTISGDELAVFASDGGVSADERNDINERDHDDDDGDGCYDDNDDGATGPDLTSPPQVLSVAQFSAFASAGEWVNDRAYDSNDDDSDAFNDEEASVDSGRLIPTLLSMDELDGGEDGRCGVIISPLADESPEPVRRRRPRRNRGVLIGNGDGVGLPPVVLQNREEERHEEEATEEGTEPKEPPPRLSTRDLSSRSIAPHPPSPPPIRASESEEDFDLHGPGATARRRESARAVFRPRRPSLQDKHRHNCHKRCKTLPSLDLSEEHEKENRATLLRSPLITAHSSVGAALSKAESFASTSASSVGSARKLMRSASGKKKKKGQHQHHRVRTMPATMLVDLGVLSPQNNHQQILEAPAMQHQHQQRHRRLGSGSHQLPSAAFRSAPGGGSSSSHRRTKTLPASIVAELSTVLAAGPDPDNGAAGVSLSMSEKWSGRTSAAEKRTPVPLGRKSCGGSAIVRRSPGLPPSGRRISSPPSFVAMTPPPPPPPPPPLSEPCVVSFAASTPPRRRRAAHHVRHMSPHAPFRQILEGAGFGDTVSGCELTQRKQLVEAAAAEEQRLRSKLLLRRSVGSSYELRRHKRIQSLPSYAELTLSSSLVSLSSCASNSLAASGGTPLPPQPRSEARPTQLPQSEGRPPLPPSLCASSTTSPSFSAARKAIAPPPTVIRGVFSDDGIDYPGRCGEEGGGGATAFSSCSSSISASSSSLSRRERCPYVDLLADRPRRRMSSHASSNASSLENSAASLGRRPPAESSALRRCSTSDGTPPASVEDGGEKMDDDEGDKSVAFDSCCRNHYEKKARRRNPVRAVKKDIRSAVGKVISGPLKAQLHNRGVELRRSKGRLV